MANKDLTPMENIGALLAAEREAKGLPIEKAARDTRIRLQRLREIEHEDFSHFGHPSYARMFLLDYAKYLGVPYSRIKNMLPERGECGAEGYQYLCEVLDDRYPSHSRNEAPLPAPRTSPIPGLVQAAVFLVLLGGLSWFGYDYYLRHSQEEANAAAKAQSADAASKTQTPTLPLEPAQDPVPSADTSSEESAPPATMADNPTNPAPGGGSSVNPYRESAPGTFPGDRAALLGESGNPTAANALQ